MNLQKMFMLLCGCICIATFAVIVVIVNTDTEKAIIQEYQQKADILLRSMKAVRAHIGGVVRPAATKLIGKDGFLVELQSTSFAANKVFAAIAPAHKYDISFRTPSTKPLNHANRANDVEADLIAKLDAMHAAGAGELVWKGVRHIGGVDYYVIAVGEVNKQSCLPATCAARTRRKACATSTLSTARRVWQTAWNRPRSSRFPSTSSTPRSGAPPRCLLRSASRGWPSSSPRPPSPSAPWSAPR